MHHVFAVKATGYGVSSYNYTRVVVMVSDVNDNKPLFTKPIYNVTVQGRIDPKMPVLHVHATDADENGKQRVEYSFYPRKRKFAIDKVTGG